MRLQWNLDIYLKRIMKKPMTLKLDYKTLWCLLHRNYWILFNCTITSVHPNSIKIKLITQNRLTSDVFSQSLGLPDSCCREDLQTAGGSRKVQTDGREDDEVRNLHPIYIYSFTIKPAENKFISILSEDNRHLTCSFFRRFKLYN